VVVVVAPPIQADYRDLVVQVGVVRHRRALPQVAQLTQVVVVVLPLVVVIPALVVQE
jgi:hypothetical protein